NLVTFDDLRHQGISKSTSDIKFDSEWFEYIKKELKTNKKQEEEKTSIEKRLKEELSENEKEKAQLVDKAYNTIMKLSEIDLKPDSAFIFQSVDFLIPLAEETGREDLVQKLRDLRKIQPEAEERVNVAMAYRRAGFSKQK
ncbi:hypothetical protein Q7C36_004247, partial [Tachysurus vachellii]